ncbi:MAG TPA: hypothetical protein VH590_07950, partial [Ktedonobacterales bacterium]
MAAPPFASDALSRYTVDMAKAQHTSARSESIADQSLAIEGATESAPPTSASAPKAPAKRSPLALLLPSLGSSVFSAVLVGVVLMGQRAIPGSDGSAALSLRLGNDMLLRG